MHPHNNKINRTILLLQISAHKYNDHLDWNQDEYLHGVFTYGQ